MTERFTVDSDGKWWDKIKHEYVTLDSLFRTVEELDNQLDIKQNTINEMIKTIRIYDDGYIDLNKKYKKLNEENEQLKDEVYDEMDDALAVLVELYEYVPFDSRKKMNRLYNRLKSLRDDMND